MRIRFQFGLKWFLLAAVLIAILVGMGKRYYDQWRQSVALERQGRAIAELEAIGVQFDRRDGVIVGLHFQNPEFFPRRVFQPRHFQMAADFGALESLELRNSGFSDADSPILRALPNLKKLGMARNPGITDRSMKAIAKANSLEELDLTATGVADQGLADLSRLPRLQKLFLNSTAITSQGLAQLRPLQSLRILSLASTNVDDSGMKAVGELRGLECLWLSDTKVRGTGLASLAKLPKLDSLRLSECLVEDGSGLAQLKQVSQLKITGSQISAGVLSHIHQMDNLRDLYLTGSHIDEDQLLELANAKQLTYVLLGKTATNDAALEALRSKLPNTPIRGHPQIP